MWMVMLRGQPTKGVRVHGAHCSRSVGMVAVSTLLLLLLLLLGHHHLFVVFPAESVTATDGGGTEWRSTSYNPISIQIHSLFNSHHSPSSPVAHVPGQSATHGGVVVVLRLLLLLRQLLVGHVGGLLHLRVVIPGKP